MKHPTPFKFLIVALMLVIGAASVVSAIQSQAMAYDMATSGETGGMGAGGCLACDGDDMATTAMDCSVICHTTVGFLNDPVSGSDYYVDRRFWAGATRPSLGWSPYIDPSPPKSILV